MHVYIYICYPTIPEYWCQHSQHILILSGWNTIWWFPQIGVPPKSSMLVEISLKNHRCWGTVPRFQEISIWIFQRFFLFGGLNPSEKYESQLRWLDSQYTGKFKKWQPNHQPDLNLQRFFFSVGFPSQSPWPPWAAAAVPCSPWAHGHSEGSPWCWDRPVFHNAESCGMGKSWKKPKKTAGKP